MSINDFPRRCARLSAGTLALCISSLLLSGCTSVSSAWFDTARGIWNRRSATLDTTRLDPSLRYLRATVNGTPVALVLGSIDTQTDPDSLRTTSIENWYSGTGELVRIKDGRLLSTTGIGPVDWRATRSSGVPSWTTVLGAPGQMWTYTRTRDVMPGYHYGLRDAITVAASAPPVATRLVTVPAERLQWFRESGSTEGTDDPRLAAQPALYGVDVSKTGNDAVVYLEQCLSTELCLTLQRIAVPAGKN
ncbi:MAG: hypothetical protein QM639_17675 [Rhodocyclaceae bacterium]